MKEKHPVLHLYRVQRHAITHQSYGGNFLIIFQNETSSKELGVTITMFWKEENSINMSQFCVHFQKNWIWKHLKTHTMADILQKPLKIIFTQLVYNTVWVLQLLIKKNSFCVCSLRGSTSRRNQVEPIWVTGRRFIRVFFFKLEINFKNRINIEFDPLLTRTSWFTYPKTYNLWSTESLLCPIVNDFCSSFIIHRSLTTDFYFLNVHVIDLYLSKLDWSGIVWTTELIIRQLWPYIPTTKGRYILKRNINNRPIWPEQHLNYVYQSILNCCG